LLLEAGVRGALYFKTGDALFLTYGFTERAVENREVHERFYDSEGNVLYHKCKPSDDPNNPVNSLGFRGPEILKKKPGTVRIICLGGSTTYGLGLSYAKTYPKLLQDRLDQEAGKNRYEVINAGMSAYRLHHIAALYSREIARLEPDVVILMNVVNNLVADAGDFAFIRIEGEDNNTLRRLSKKIVAKTRRYSLLINSIDNIAQKGFRYFLVDFNFARGAQAIMRSTNMWNRLSEDLHGLFSLFSRHNSGVHVFVLDEPINTLGFPELAPPMEKAYGIQQAVSENFDNVHHVALMPVFNEAQNRGEKIWIAYSDPLHLSRDGNDLLARVLCREIMALQQ